MTSSNGNIFRVTGPLCREFTGHRWIPHTKASDVELWNNHNKNKIQQTCAHFIGNALYYYYMYMYCNSELGLNVCTLTWWCHQMETFSALLAICAENSPVPGEFPAHTERPVTRSFDVFFHLCLNKRLNKQSWGWWLETPSRPLWRCCNVFCDCAYVYVISCVLIVWFYTVKMDAIQSFHPACTFTWQLEAHDYGRAVTE